MVTQPAPSTDLDRPVQRVIPGAPFPPGGVDPAHQTASGTSNSQLSDGGFGDARTGRGAPGQPVRIASNVWTTSASRFGVTGSAGYLTQHVSVRVAGELTVIPFGGLIVTTRP